MIIKACVECGADFEVDDTKRNWQHKRFCSGECQKAVERRKKRESYTPVEWPQHKTCIRCGTPFLIHEGGNVAQKFCTDACQRQAKEERRLAEVEARRLPKRCEQCGSVFLGDKYAGSKQRFCSDECRRKSRNKERYWSEEDRSKIRAGYKYDFKKLKPQILERDGGKCVICGSSEKVHIHHWDNSGGTVHVNNDPDNLGAVCGRCHYALHAVTLARIDGHWVLDGKIFGLLGLTGSIPIKP